MVFHVWKLYEVTIPEFTNHIVLEHIKAHRFIKHPNIDFPREA